MFFGKPHRHGTPLDEEFTLTMFNCISIQTFQRLQARLSTFLKARMDPKNSSEPSKIVGKLVAGASQRQKMSRFSDQTFTFDLCSTETPTNPSKRNCINKYNILTVSLKYEI